MKGSEVAEVIRAIVLEKRYMDVGRGAEVLLGTSKYKLDRAVGILVNEGTGFTKINLEIPQIGTWKNVVVPFLLAPGVTHADLIADMDSVTALVEDTMKRADIERASKSAQKQAEWDANLAQVRKYLAEGLTADQIAEKMERKKRTIDTWIYWMGRSDEKLPKAKIEKKSPTSKEIEARYSQYDEPEAKTEKEPEGTFGETLLKLNEIANTFPHEAGELHDILPDLGTPIENVDELTVSEFIAYAQENGLGGFTPMILEEYYALLSDHSSSGVRAALVLLQNACSFYKEYFSNRFIYFKK